MSESKAVAVPDYLKKFMDQGSKDAASMASASVSVPRISLKGKKFQFINGDDESKKTDEIFVSILAVDPEGPRMIKTFYANGYNPNDTAPPDCSSSTGVGPDSWVSNPVSQSCASCPKNVFGSATSPTGKKTKACRDAKRLWVAKAEDVGGTVYGLNVPVTSLKDMADYGKDIRSVGVPLSAVVTRIFMDEDSEFPKIHFERAGFLNEEIGLQAIERNESRDWMAAIDLRNALPAPEAGAQQRALPQAAITANAIEGESKNVTPKATPGNIDEIASNW